MRSRGLGVVAALFAMACSRSGLDVPKVLDAAPDADAGLPRPMDCLDDELPAATAQTTSPEGLRELDGTPCPPWDPPAHPAVWATPPQGPPHVLWKTSESNAWVYVVVSIDGSIWTIEYHPPSDVGDYYTIASFDRSGSLRWRSRPLCDLQPELSVDPEGVGVVTATTKILDNGVLMPAQNHSVVFRVAPDGSISSAWADPEGKVVGLFGVRSGPVLYAQRFGGVIASCKAQRPMWIRTVPTSSFAKANCFPWVNSVLAEPDGTAWLSMAPASGDPVRVAQDGSILGTLPRHTPLNNGYPYARVVETQDGAVLVDETTLDGQCERWPTETAVLWRNDQVVANWGVSYTSATDMMPAGFSLAPDYSIWSSKQGYWLARFAAGAIAWKRTDIVPSGSWTSSRWSADGSMLTLLGQGIMPTALARIQPDGTEAWSIPLDGPVQSWFAVAPDGVVYLITSDGRLTAIQTDFAPLRLAGEVLLPNGIDD